MSKLSLAHFPPALTAELDAAATALRVCAGDVVLDHGAVIRHVPIVRDGALRITRANPDGGEIVLYYIEAGEACAATMSSWVGRQYSGVRATAEVDSELLLLPVDELDEWMGRYPPWRRFVLQTFQERFDELLDAVDAVAFQNLEQRLLASLREKAQLRGGDTVAVTHQALADELYSSRVVVSRLLKTLERRGVVRLGRGEVELMRA